MIGRIVRKSDGKTVKPGDILETPSGLKVRASILSYGHQGARIKDTYGRLWLASEVGCYHTVSEEP